MKMNICFFLLISGLLLSSCTTRYDTYSQKEFESMAREGGFTIFARAQLPSTITADGIGDRILNGAWPGGSRYSQEQANQIAMNDCGPGCIISSMNGQITPAAQKYIDIAKEKKLKAKLKAEEAEKEKAEMNEKYLASLVNFSSIELCDDLINSKGLPKTWMDEYEALNQELIARGLSNENCNVLTGRFTDDQKKVIAELEAEQKAEQLKQQRIAVMKKDCEDLGFKDGTEEMGNCVLKLMELEGNNSQTIVTTSSGSDNSQALVDIEKEKLKAQREALKVQQDQLKAEQERVAQERRKALKKQADQSINQGFCLMSGGSYADCY